MKLSNQMFGLALSVLALSISTGCGILPINSAQPTRAATQTPYIVYVPVTTTPEQATITPLATTTSAAPPTATRTLTRAAVVRPTATRTKTAAPVAAGPSATSAPACTSGPVLDPIEPNDGAERRTFATRNGSDTFIYRWTPPANAGGDDFGYKIQINATHLNGKPAGSDTIYIQHNKYVSDQQKQNCGGRSCLIYDNARVHNLPAGDEDVNVSWYISVVKFSGSISDAGYLTGTAVECSGSRTTPRTIILKVIDEG